MLGASMRIPVLLISLLLALTSCTQAAKMVTVDQMVAEIVKHATADDTDFFVAYLDAPYKEKANQLIQQIKASGMADNYKSRLEVSETKARLNYHYLERGCHFQIDLMNQDGAWLIQRVWFCK